MQFLKMAKDMTLSALSSIVGERNVDTVLNANSLERSVNVGSAFEKRNKDLVKQFQNISVDNQKKLSILNQFVGDSDIYEKAYLGSEDDWVTLSQYNCFTDAIKIPDEVKLPPSEGLLGNSEPIPGDVYRKCTESLKIGTVDPTIFSEYNASFLDGRYGITTGTQSTNNTPFEWFKLPWGEVCLYSSLNKEMLYFPVYPDNLGDGVRANYDEMGEMLYQYEPWKVYKSSGPREISFTFNFHRDMWTGDHRDGNANNLIRGCEANCYPSFDGSLVNVSLVTLYIHGQNFITGVMTDCKAQWDKPIGLDGFYLKCELSFTIVEVSPEALSFETVRNKGLIG